ncbi:MAG: carbohydrate kinase [Sphaerochaetaceae bacterium]|nr:carbohydrate kinase [Spirochaetales bacterium]MDY5499753.1 carbohydrate kinase [Sphaerochaetaceae bacterium]
MRFVAFGEILFDVIMDQAKLGGAPLNVASHIQRLGSESLVVSAVGRDELGSRALKEISDLGLSTRYIKRSAYPTGRADVVLRNGNADYTFNDPSAWDDITLAAPLPPRVDVLYWGSLVQRHETSRQSLKTLLEETNAPLRFFDVNIRKHFYTPAILDDGITHASILKMNDEEVAIVSSAVGVKGANLEESVRNLLAAYPLEMVLVTLGGEGSECFTKEGKRFKQACGKVEVVDTVGAGDSLSAAFISTLVGGGSVQEALHRGTLLANYVCGHRGAIPTYDEKITASLGL